MTSTDPTARHYRLPDGRRLGYAELGDPDGRPLLFFHGWPGSRLDAGLLHATAASMGIRVIGVDRPGMGLSDPRPGRRLLDWPADVGALADALDLDRFAIMGFSGGGPYAAACARMIAPRLTGCGVLAGLGPREAGVRGMMLSNRVMFALAARRPRVVGAMLWHGLGKAFQREGTADRALLRMMPSVPDRVCLERPGLRAILVASGREAFRQGHAWLGEEAAIYCRPWEFRLGEIPCPHVFLWHGGLDRNVPIAMARHVADAIPGCQANLYPEEGHYSLPVLHMADILRTLTAA